MVQCKQGRKYVNDVSQHVYVGIHLATLQGVSGTESKLGLAMLPALLLVTSQDVM